MALSRCRTLEGLVLSAPIPASAIKTDGTIQSFSKTVEQNQPDENTLNNSRQEYEKQLLLELFDFKALESRLQYLRRMAGENSASLTEPFMQLTRQLHEKCKNELTTVGDDPLRHEEPGCELDVVARSAHRDSERGTGDADLQRFLHRESVRTAPDGSSHVDPQHRLARRDPPHAQGAYWSPACDAPRPTGDAR